MLAHLGWAQDAGVVVVWSPRGLMKVVVIYISL